MGALFPAADDCVEVCLLVLLGRSAFIFRSVTGSRPTQLSAAGEGPCRDVEWPFRMVLPVDRVC